MSDHGERGDQGQRGIAGERGPKGDHGQVGEAGARGPTGATEPARLWFNIKKSTWILLAFLLLVISGAFSQWRTAEVAKDVAADLAAQEAANSRARARANCEATNTATEKLRGVVIAATSGATSLDYTKIPEFAAVDPDTQRFLLALRARSTTDGASAARQQLLVGLDLRDCNAEFPPQP